MNNGITRRRAAVGLAALGGAALFPRHAAADEAALLEGARREGTLTWYIAQVDGETAEVMGCSVGTVKSQHARAIARLRQLMPDRRTA